MVLYIVYNLSNISNTDQPHLLHHDNIHLHMSDSLLKDQKSMHILYTQMSQ